MLHQHMAHLFSILNPHSIIFGERGAESNSNIENNLCEERCKRAEEEFATIIEDDDGPNVDSEKELSPEQKLELVITKKSFNNNNNKTRIQYKNQLYP
ncbi:hypothetical protein TNCV_2310041 [Trichonephila clavipes]|nr:hypothetical protein TNCV_2310041 [Trichonephila clavipes]